MKITDIKAEKVRIELTAPFRVAFAEINYSENLLLKIRTDEGIDGYGEAAPMPFVTGETIDSVISVINLLRPGLIGMNPMDIEKIHERMDSCIYGNSSAKCAVDLSMYDLMGKFMGQPVYKLLGGYSNRVQNDITIGINTPELMPKKPGSTSSGTASIFSKSKQASIRRKISVPCISSVKRSAPISVSV